MMELNINGEKITSKMDLYRVMDGLSVEKCKSVGRLIALNQESAAIERMEYEKDPVKKEKMKRLIEQKEYDFDLLFGPKK